MLDINILPENRQYLYDHYYDNCATRVRDLIDLMVDGRLRASTQDPSPLTLREQSTRHSQHSFLMDLLLMFLMSDFVDGETRQWDDMFLPAELMKHVGDLRVPDERGGMIPLVSETSLYHQATGRDPVPEKPSPRWRLGLLIGAVIGIIGGLLWQPGLGRTRRGEAALRIGCGVHSALLGLVLGLAGCMLFFMSLFTDHVATHGNENLFLANPLTLLALPLGIATAAGRARAQVLLKWLWRIHLALAVILLMLKAVPAFDQQNWLSISLLLPMYLGLAGRRLTELAPRPRR
jgi:hypothetical protein